MKFNFKKEIHANAITVITVVSWSPEGFQWVELDDPGTKPIFTKKINSPNHPFCKQVFQESKYIGVFGNPKTLKLYYTANWWEQLYKNVSIGVAFYNI